MDVCKIIFHVTDSHTTTTTQNNNNLKKQTKITRKMKRKKSYKRRAVERIGRGRVFSFLVTLFQTLFFHWYDTYLQLWHDLYSIHIFPLLSEIFPLSALLPLSVFLSFSVIGCCWCCWCRCHLLIFSIYYSLLCIYFFGIFSHASRPIVRRRDLLLWKAILLSP